MRTSLSIAVIGCAVAVAACGSSTKHPTATTSADVALLRFSTCMRSHGVANFPDLGGSGTRIEGSGQTLSVNGVPINAPAFLTARAECEKYEPHVNASPAQIVQQTRKGLQFARCMRSHGVPTFPDPKVATGTNGNGVVDLRGSGLNFQSPAFKAAAAACGGGPKGPL